MLLLDEPLGALDLKLRRSMQMEIKRIQTEVGLTFIHVTHDQEEAMTMADTVAVMNGGVIEQMGAPDELYENPRTTFVANFLGQSNLIEGTIKSRSGDLVTVDMHGVDVSVTADRSHAEGDRGWIGIRPEKVLIGEEGENLDAPGNSVPGGVVSDVSFVGVSTQYLVRMPWGQELQVFEQNTGRRRMFRRGDRVELSWRPSSPSCSTTVRTPRPARSAWTPRERDRPARRGTDRLPAAPPRRCLARPLLRDPFYSLVATSLYDPGGSVFRGYEMTWAFGNYADALREYWGPLLALAAVRRDRDRDLPGARLRAGLRHRVQGRALEEPDAGAGHRTVLHQLPGPHAVVEADPGRRRLHREHPADAADPRRRRPAARDAGRGGRRPHLQLPALHGAAALRQHRQDRPRG